MATEEKKNRSLLSELANSPEGKMAMIQAGVTLLQGSQPGESEVSSFGRAIGEGVNTYNRGLEDKRETQMEQQEAESQQRLRDARIDYLGQRGDYYQAAGQAQQTTGTGQGMGGAYGGSMEGMIEELWKHHLENASLGEGGGININEFKAQVMALGSQFGRGEDVVVTDEGEPMILRRDPATNAPMMDGNGDLLYYNVARNTMIPISMEQAAGISPQAVAQVQQQQAEEEAAGMESLRAMMMGGSPGQ